MINVCKAQPIEAQEIKELLNYVWIDTYKNFFTHETVKNITENFQTVKRTKLEIEDESRLFAVAKDNGGKIVGLAFANIKDESIFLNRLYIHPDYQRKGIGTSLLKFVADNYKDYDTILLEVEQENPKGLNFYKKHGFTIVKSNEYTLNGDKFSTFLMKCKK